MISKLCWYCGEVIDPEAADPFSLFTSPKHVQIGSGETLHKECFLRVVIGSVGHQKRNCSCYGGTEEDPPGASLHEAALAAAQFFVDHYNKIMEAEKFKQETGFDDPLRHLWRKN